MLTINYMDVESKDKLFLLQPHHDTFWPIDLSHLYLFLFTNNTVMDHYSLRALAKAYLMN